MSSSKFRSKSSSKVTRAFLTYAAIPAALGLAISQASAQSLSPAARSEAARTETIGVPGPRTCFWARGPHSADPYINLAYPDANVFYWAATFSIPEGAQLSIEGEFARSRYMSFISYDARGRPIESLADYLIAPRSENDVNPYVIGNRRDSNDRNYSIRILPDAPKSQRAVGERGTPESVNVLHAPPYGNGQHMVLYRIYLPDDATGPTASVALPKPVLTLADGRRLEGAAACTALDTDQTLALTPDAIGIPPGVYRELIDQEGRPDTWPAKNPGEWFIQLDRESLLGIYTGKINDDARRSEGGFYPNLDNHYIRTVVNRKHGPVFFVRGKAPTTPKTFGGNEVMGDGELRYWSICSNQGISNTRVNDCLFDEEIPLDQESNWMVMVSREEDRPRNARPECGIGWLPMAADGDGLFDEDVTIVQIRHMLTAPDFSHSVQRVEKQADLVDTMGPYMPRTGYMLVNQAEAFFPCFAGLTD